jgi:Flp pilus assembly pilin Flp
MLKVLKKVLKNERGQAFAEYFVLFPGSILMVLAGFSLVGRSIKDAYCEVVDVFSSGICQTAEVDQRDLEEGDPVVDGSPTPTPTEEICVVLQAEDGCSQCDQSQDCTCLPGVNAGTYSASENVESFVIKAGQEYHVYHTGYTDDGCYHVTIEGNMAAWEKVGGGNACKDVSHLQSWYTPLCE